LAEEKKTFEDTKEVKKGKMLWEELRKKRKRRNIWSVDVGHMISGGSLYVVVCKSSISFVPCTVLVSVTVDRYGTHWIFIVRLKSLVFFYYDSVISHNLFLVFLLD
jgi:hypothetical protein